MQLKQPVIARLTHWCQMHSRGMSSQEEPLALARHWHVSPHSCSFQLASDKGLKTLTEKEENAGKPVSHVMVAWASGIELPFQIKSPANELKQRDACFAHGGH